MNMRVGAAIAAAFLMSCAPSVTAKEAAAKPKKIKLETVNPKKPQLDPRLGYILVRLGPVAEGGRKPDPVSFVRLDEVTGRHFKFANPADIPADHWRTASVAVHVGRPLAERDGYGVYLVGAYPGRWSISGVGGTCLSLGSYAFDIKQGEIADIGLLLTAREDGKSTAPELKDAKLSQDLIDFGVVSNMVMSNALYAKPIEDNAALPAFAAALPVRKAVLDADFRFDNVCLDMINRAASLPPLGHQPSMSVDEARAAIAALNPPELVESVRKRKERESQAKK